MDVFRAAEDLSSGRRNSPTRATTPDGEDSGKWVVPLSLEKSFEEKTQPLSRMRGEEGRGGEGETLSGFQSFPEQRGDGPAS